MNMASTVNFKLFDSGLKVCKQNTSVIGLLGLVLIANLVDSPLFLSPVDFFVSIILVKESRPVTAKHYIELKRTFVIINFE